jgi:hypothetical protein
MAVKHQPLHHLKRIVLYLKESIEVSFTALQGPTEAKKRTSENFVP